MSPTAVDIHALTLAIGGLRLGARDDETELDFPPQEEALRRFLVAGQAADVQWSLCWDGCERERQGTLYVHRGQWHITRGEGPDHPDHPTFIPLRVPGGVSPAQQTTRRLAIVSADLKSVELHLDRRLEPQGPINPFGYLLAEVYFILRFTRHPGLLLHAAAVRDGRGGAWVFPGPSGAGKSTLARIWAEHGPAPPLSDESTLLLPGPDGRIWAHGTPWHSRAQIADPGAAPVVGLGFLEHGPAACWRDLDPVHALSGILSQAQVPSWHREGLARSLDFIERLREQAPVRTLAFRPDPTVIDHVLAG